jgi:hypothetical protein
MRCKLARWVAWTMVALATPSIGAAADSGRSLATSKIVNVDPRGAENARLEDRVNAALAHYALAVRTLPPDSISACYAPMGELLLPGMAPLVGRDAIREFLVPMVAGSVVDSTTLSGEILAQTSLMASQWGSYRQVAGPKGGAHALYVGRFSALWGYSARESRWLLIRLMMQPLPTPTTPAAAPAPGSSPAGPTPGK